MTGAGAYMYVVWGIWLRHCLNGRQDEFVLNWSNKLISLPDIVRAPGGAMNTSSRSVVGGDGSNSKDVTNGQDRHMNGRLKKIS